MEATKQRVLKFRIWDIPNEEFLELRENGYYYAQDGHGHSSLNYCVQSADFHVEQYTGLLDKNGVEIYEGDIMSRLYDEGLGVVRWDQGTCSFDIGNGGSWEHLFDTTGIGDLGRNHWEIIGNIHQHSELLK